MRNFIEEFKKRKLLYFEILILVLLIPISVKVATSPQTKTLFSRALTEKTSRLWLEPQEIRVTTDEVITFKLKAETPQDLTIPEVNVVLLNDANQFEFMPGSLESHILQIKDSQTLPGKVSFKLKGLFSGQTTIAQFSFRALAPGTTFLKFAPETQVLDATRKNTLEAVGESKILID